MKLFSFLLICGISIFTNAYGQVTQQPLTAQNNIVETGKQEAPIESSIYFRANGVDPVWTLNIAPYQIDFKTEATGFEPYHSPHVEPVRGMDSNVKKYMIQTEAGHLAIEIAHVQCRNENSRERFSYSVIVSLKQGRDTMFTYFNGCGRYITNPGLEATWVLSQIKADTVTAAQFNDTLPYLELHANGNSFSGYGGCNTIKGRIFSERTLLRFTDLVLSKRKCTTIAREEEFVNALQFSTQFEIKDERLILSNPGGVTLVFKKSG